MSDNNNTPTPKEWKKKLEYIVKYRLTTDFVTDLQILTELFSTLLSQQKQELVEEIIDEIKKDFKRRTEKDEKPDYTIGRERTLADVLGRLRNYLLENK